MERLPYDESNEENLEQETHMGTSLSSSSFPFLERSEDIGLVIHFLGVGGQRRRGCVLYNLPCSPTFRNVIRKDTNEGCAQHPSVLDVSCAWVGALVSGFRPRKGTSQPKSDCLLARSLRLETEQQKYQQDLRNHGHSFHHNEHNYSVMAEDVEKFIHQHDLAKCVLIGHSMGAKTAMTVALQSSDLVSALIPVDNAPANAPLKSDFGKYVRGMQEVEAQGITKQSDADKILKEYEDALPIRQFLLTNLVRAEDSQKMKFRIPLSVLGPAIPAMADFPFREPGSVTYDGPTLFIRGTKSNYVSDDMVPAIKKFFPNAEIADVEAGHWLISENPEAFRQAVVKFLQDLP
ncbi:LOW QUALITY PROTEIN: abhydrolase domain-containing protein C22H12.03 [Aspergillus udagawae]|uniref:Abhydrolase domain-containing protein C22H12.03 n=1 Tax=Aspergillus udagawae TaxID=91492 RepID=A0A8H3RR70_9EURO|nr:LOW QUALITY PROTEIN: abhydrolase domain-containing protein C22H12.03 [Aspergillus udagawae]